MDQLSLVGQRDSLETFPLAILEDQALDGKTTTDASLTSGRDARSILIDDLTCQ